MDEKNLNSEEGCQVPSMTAKLADLVLWLIEKQPGSRGDWEQVSSHPFWGKKYTTDAPESLPMENAYYNLVSKMEDQTQKSRKHD